MKKLSVIAVALMLIVIAALPASALTLTENTISNVFTDIPAGYENATVVALADSFEEGVTNARLGTNDMFTYVFLKADGLGDYTVSFDVAEAGYYKFGFRLMGWTVSVPRSTNVQIDDSEKVYIVYDYAEADQHLDHYWYGIGAELTAGTHTVTLSLADDFDDSSVKSLYFADFLYVKAESPAAAVPEVVAEPEPEPEPVIIVDPPVPEVVVEPVVQPAPQTFDAIVALAVLAAASVAGAIASKKR